MARGVRCLSLDRLRNLEGLVALGRKHLAAVVGLAQKGCLVLLRSETESSRARDPGSERGEKSTPVEKDLFGCHLTGGNVGCSVVEHERHVTPNGREVSSPPV